MIKDFYHRKMPAFLRNGLSTYKRDLVFEIERSRQYLSIPTAQKIGPRLGALRGKYAGQRCFIMGNGPSLNDMNLDLFENEFVWGSNKCYLLFDRISWRPSFYVGVDRRVIPDIKDEIVDLTENLFATRFFFPFDFFLSGELHNAPNIYWYFEQGLNPYSLPYGVFSRNASRKIYSVYTVTVAMIQLAVYLGFNPIYLIGCDTNYSIPATVLAEKNNEELLLSTQDDDMNHFSKDYFGKGSKWHAPHVERMLWHYDQVKKACDGIGINIINATLGGKLDVFPRVAYDELF